MAAQFLADLRGILAGTGDYFANPLVLCGVLLAIWFLWRRA
jgi:hypothetical protein